MSEAAIARLLPGAQAGMQNVETSGGLFLGVVGTFLSPISWVIFVVILLIFKFAVGWSWKTAALVTLPVWFVISFTMQHFFAKVGIKIFENIPL